MADNPASALFRMLADLAEDPEKLQQFKSEKSRSSVMREYGLTAEQQDLLEKAMDESRHEQERYAHMTKLVGDEATAKLVPLC